MDFNSQFLGLLLGFSGGSYYQYQRMAPYVNLNARLSSQLWKMESMITGMNNLMVYEEKGAEKWGYKMQQGFVECYYNPYGLPPVSTTTTPATPTAELAEEDYEYKEYPNYDSKENTKENTKESAEEDSKNDLVF